MKKKKTKSPAVKTGGPSFSTVGERLSQKSPELMKKIASFREPDRSADRSVEVLGDLFSYSWRDFEAFKEGVKLGLEGEYEDAIALFREILRFDPDAYPAYHLMGHFYGSQGDFKQEIDCYRKVVKLKPGYPQVYYDLGVAYWLLGNEKKSFAAFKRAAPLAPEFAVADYWFAFSFDKLGLHKTAGEKSKGLSERDRILAQACYMMGNAFVELRLHVAARHAFKKAARMRPDFAEAYYQLGELHIKKLRNPERAAKYLGRAEQLFVERDDLQRAALAHQLYCRWEEIKEKDAAGEGWLKEGLRLQRVGRYQAAIDAYRLAIQLKPACVEAHYNMGIAYGCLADERGAASRLDAFASSSEEEMEDDAPPAREPSAGQRVAGGEEIEKAVWAFKDTLRVKPDFVHAYIGLGASYLKSGRVDEAISVLQEAAPIEPQDFAVYYYLGMARRMRGEYAKAVEALKQAAALKPEAEQAHFYLGLVYADLGRFQEASESFQEATRVKPDFAAAHDMLGDLFYGKIRDLEKAALHLKKAEKLYLKLEDYRNAGRVRQMIESLPG